MKMTTYKRILSALLAVVLLLSYVPGSVFAQDGEEFRIVSKTRSAGTLCFFENEKIVISVAGIPEGGQLQWQIAMPDGEGWVDIMGQEETELPLSYALIANVMDEAGCTSIRCTAEANGELHTTSAITVQVLPEAEPITAEPLQAVEETTIPTEETTAPTEETTIPTEETTAPTEETTIPTEETTAPTEETTIPTEETTAPTEETTIPTEGATVPTEETTIPTEEIIVPTEETTIPTEETTAPTEMTTEPRIADNNGEPSSASAAPGVSYIQIQIEYVNESGETLFDPYIAYLEPNTEFHASVNSPVKLGYGAFYENSTSTEPDAVTVELNYTSVTANETITVVYKKVPVPYYVRYLLQNINNDLYTEDAGLYKQETGLEGTYPEVEIEIPLIGFEPLYHQPANIAADGSTEFEVRYDRLYYLINFRLDGGYGVDPIYARYGTNFVVGTPAKAGYVFGGWDLVEQEYERIDTLADGTEVKNIIKETNLADGVADALPGEVPAANRVYQAIWKRVETTYTVVYWKENADDTNYSYWGYQTFSELSATVVDGEAFDANRAAVEESVDVLEDENQYFTFNPAKSDKGVVVEGDGSTVVNVYYTRNYYTILFTGYGKCGLTEHTHGDGTCNEALICGQTAHTHTADCNEQLICTIPEHTAHTDDCLKCGREEHTHTAECLSCGQTEHVHGEACCMLEEHTHVWNSWRNSCCTLEEHTHSKNDCYRNVTGVGNLVNNVQESPEDPEQGIISDITYRNGRQNRTVTAIYIGTTWYQYTGSIAVGGIIAPTCGKSAHTHSDSGDDCVCPYTEHTHGDGNCAYCSEDLEEHTHSGSCYDHTEHTHTEYCYKDQIHTHTADCYSYSCGASGHVHTEKCYRDCTKYEHSHTGNCNNNGSSNVLYSITAKYDQTISSIWPTYDILQSLDNTYKNRDNDIVDNRGNIFRGWNFFGNDGSLVTSKRLNLTADLCDEANASNIITGSAEYGTNYTVELNYMFERFVQEAKEGDTEFNYFNGKYYDSDPAYYQILKANSNSFGQKDITGMNPVGTDNDTGNRFRDEEGNWVYPNYLYYDRNTFKLEFMNVDKVVRTESPIMYGKPLGEYAFGEDGQDYEPPYPSTYEPDAYEFDDWYTTPQFFEGTQFDFATATMPNSDLMLYANWVPKVRTVEFYDTYEDMTAGNINNLRPTLTVPHGSIITTGTVADPAREGYTFAGWFYFENGAKKRFNVYEMEVRQDLKLYAEWTSTTHTEYTISYKGTVDGVEVELAAPDHAYAFAGLTKTFTAKAGEDLYPEYQAAVSGKMWLPNTNSHSLLLHPYPENYNPETTVMNPYTFWYTYADIPPYTVQYLDAKDNSQLLPDKEVEDNHAAVVTEQFRYIPGYMPDAAHKRLVISANEDENVIIFYYVKEELEEDEKGSTYYQVTHYTMDIDEKGDPIVIGGTAADPVYQYSEYTSYEKIAKFGDTVSAEPIEIPGFQFNAAADGTKQSATLTEPEEGKEAEYEIEHLKLYYDRIAYPYEVHYLDYTTHQEVAPQKTVENKYFGTQITEEAITVPGYSVIGSSEKTISINTANNVITFYYEQKKADIIYVAKCIDEAVTSGFGHVTPTAERQVITATGSTAVVYPGFTFLGWFADENGQTAVEETWITGSRIKPVLPDEPEDQYIYYALFSPIKEDLKITKTGTELDQNDTFLFRVTGTNVLGQTVDLTVSIQGAGSVMIKDLYCSDENGYTVTELTNWSWTYAASGDTVQKAFIKHDDDKTLYECTFTNQAVSVDWLHGEAVNENQFS